jgi:hypothetical protein
MTFSSPKSWSRLSPAYVAQPANKVTTANIKNVRKFITLMALFLYFYKLQQKARSLANNSELLVGLELISMP